MNNKSTSNKLHAEDLANSYQHSYESGQKKKRNSSKDSKPLFTEEFKAEIRLSLEVILDLKMLNEPKMLARVSPAQLDYYYNLDQNQRHELFKEVIKMSKLGEVTLKNTIRAKTKLFPDKLES
jgi:hypothetical protein